jgi:hypothetical protein
MDAKQYKRMARRGAAATVFKLKTRAAKKGHITDVCQYVEVSATRDGFRARDVMVSILNTGEGWAVVVDDVPIFELTYQTKTEAARSAIKLASELNEAPGGRTAEEFIAQL